MERVEEIKKRHSDGNVVTYNSLTELTALFQNDVRTLLSIIETQHQFIDAFPALQHNMSLLADNNGMVKWSMASSVMDGFLEGYQQIKERTRMQGYL